MLELSNAFNSSQESFLPLTMRSCPFGGGGEDLQSTAVCARYQNAVSNALHNQDIEYVIILSRWDNGVDGIYYSYKTYSSQFDAISKLLLMGKRVIFIQPYPAYTVPIGDHLATQLWRSGTLSKGPLIRRSEYLERISLEADLIKDFINNPNFIYIATQDIFCGEGQNGVCVYHEHGSPLYSDESHLTNLGALKIVNKIMKIPILKSN